MAEILRERITQSDESVASIARACGIAQPVLHRFAKGERDLTLRTADKLLAYFALEVRPRKGGQGENP